MRPRRGSAASTGQVGHSDRRSVPTWRIIVRDAIKPGLPEAYASPNRLTTGHPKTDSTPLTALNTMQTIGWGEESAKFAPLAWFAWATVIRGGPDSTHRFCFPLEFHRPLPGS